MLGSSADDYIGIWNTETGALYRKLKEGNVYSLTWSPDGKLLASGCIFCIHVWKAEDGKGYYKLIPPIPSPIFCVAWSPDGGILASGSESKSENLQLWDVKTRQLLSTFKGHSDYVSSVAWSPDGRLLASGSGDRTIRLWNTRTERETGILEGHTNAVSSLSFSFDGRLIASK